MQPDAGAFAVPGVRGQAFGAQNFGARVIFVAQALVWRYWLKSGSWVIAQ